jgi:hypothetical protein
MQMADRLRVTLLSLYTLPSVALVSLLKVVRSLGLVTAFTMRVVIVSTRKRAGAEVAGVIALRLI